MGNKWTKDQELAIYSKWRDEEKTKSSNILVNAAAGSGKTAVLVERIINKICKDVTSPDYQSIDSLLVVTFTNAAAKEMQQRISDALSNRYKIALRDKDYKVANHLSEQNSLLYVSDIMTIDAFCMKIIKNYFYLLNIDPNFSVVDKAESDMIKDEAIEELFESYYGDEEFIKLLSLYSDNRYVSGLANIIIKIYEFTRTIAYPDKWMDEKCEEFNNFNEKSDWVSFLKNYVNNSASIALDIIISALKDMISYVSGLENIDDEEIEKWIKNNPPCEENDLYLSFGTHYKVMYDEYFMYKSVVDKSWDEIYNIVSNFEFTALNKKFPPVDKEKLVKDKEIISSFTSKRNEAKKQFEKIKEVVSMNLEDNSKLLRENLYPQALLLVKFTRLFGEIYSRMKDERNIREFNDIEHLCLKLFNEHPSVCEELKDKYSEILMDEYQDSNELQEEIFTKISRGDNIFMVGDVKQSIYRFRSSEPELFKSKCVTYKKEEGELNRKVVLSKNFRSRKEVLNSINSIFETVMSEDVGGIEYDVDQKLYPEESLYKEKNHGNCNQNISECHFILNDVAEDSEKIEALSDLELEARFIAKKIKELKDNKFLVKDKRLIKTFDENGKVVEISEEYYRPVQNKDIVILMSSQKKAAKVFMKELSRAGIECFAHSSGYFDKTEIRMVLSLLKVIDNPYNDVPLIALMRSVVEGFTDDDLCVIRSNSDECFYDAVKEMAVNENESVKEVSDKCKKMLSDIKRWKEYARFMSCDRLISTLYEETGIYSYCEAVFGQDAVKNLQLLFSRAKNYEDSGYKGLFNFIRYINKLKNKQEDMSQAILVGEESDAVRIMTIHKSKGLEFPVVFLARCSSKFIDKESAGRVILDKNYGFGLDFINYEKSYYHSTISKLSVKEKIKRESTSEEMRKLYVALTRAKEKLFVTAVCDRAKEENSPKKFREWDLAYDKDNKKVKSYIAENVNTFIDWIAPVVINDSTNWHYEVTEYNDVFCNLDYENISTQSDDITKSSLISVSEYKYPGINLTKLKPKISVTEIKNLNNDVIFELLEKPDFMEENTISGASYGTAVHYIMQKFIPKENVTCDDVAEFIADMVKREEITPQEADFVNPQDIVDFYSSELGQRIIKSDNVVREAPFEIEIDASEVYDVETDEKILLQGIIDCYFYEGDEIVIVDYKTDRYKDIDEIKEKYSVQIDYYSKAIEKICKKSVKNKIIYLFFTKSMIQY